MVELLERDDDLAVLAAAAESAAAGAGRVVVVSGEAGIGKSSLLSTWLAELPAETRAATGWCDDFLATTALDPLRDIARAVGGDLATAVADADAVAVRGALLDLLDHPLHPMVVVVEDAHWADEATLDVVRYVGRRVGDLRGLLVVSYRDDDVGPRHPLTAVLGALPPAVVVRIRPARLSPAAVTRLVEPSGLDTGEVVAATRGNPFFVTELARDPDADSGVPATVSDAVLARLGSLDAGARHAVEILSVSPGGLPARVVHRVVGDPAVLAPAERRGMLVVETGGVRFQHDVARRAVETSLTSTERRAAHRRILDVLLVAHADADAGTARTDMDTATLLHHAVGCDDQQVIATRGVAAADEAFAAGASREALTLHDHVLRVADLLSNDVHARIREQHAWTLHNVHAFDEAVRHARVAVRLRRDLGDPAAIAMAEATLSRMLYLANDPDGGLLAAARAVEAADATDDALVQAEAALAQATLRILLDSSDDRGRLAALEVLETARAHGRTDLESLALNYAAVASYWKDPAQQVSNFEEAVRVARAGGHLEVTSRAYVNLVSVLSFMRDPRVWAWLDEAVDFMLDHDFVTQRYNLLGQRASLLTERGRWNEAEELLDELLASTTDPGLLELELLHGQAALYVRRGDEEAAGVLRRAWPIALDSQAAQYIGPLGAIRLHYAWLHDDDELARDTRDHLVVTGVDPWTLGELAVYLHRTGLEVPADWSTAGIPAGWAQVLRGRWEAAAAVWEEADNPYEQALAMAESGEPEPTLAALDLLMELGAQPAVRIVRRRLRELGVRSLPRGPMTDTRENPGGLTNRQLEVYGLLAEGLTNAEIADRLVLSVRTVDHHVSAILDKLGVESRHEAAEVAADLLA